MCWRLLSIYLVMLFLDFSINPLLHKFAIAVLLPLMIDPFLRGCSDRLPQWNFYYAALKNERLFNNMQWPNEEWV